MLKILAFLLLVPTTGWTSSPTTYDTLIQIRADHPQLQEMEVELANGQVVTLKDFLQSIAEVPAVNDVTIFGGEVPWPKGENGKENKNNDN